MVEEIFQRNGEKYRVFIELKVIVNKPDSILLNKMINRYIFICDFIQNGGLILSVDEL